jgi:hypothetical protein
LTLLADVTAILASGKIAHAVIGAAALAVHGVARATADLDLLAIDDRCLDSSLWRELRARGIEVEIRRGDSDDPLAGVVRINAPGESSIDLVIGRWRWQSELLGRAERIELGDVSVPVVTAPDFVLLKLYAGGPQDAWDIDQLLDVDPALAARVEESVAALPADAIGLWRQILANRGGATSI